MIQKNEESKINGNDVSAPRFLSSLAKVSERLNISESILREWRDEFNCKFLDKSPYDIESILLWINKRAQIEIDKMDPVTQLEIRKKLAEIKSAEIKNKIISWDKAFWPVAIGVAYTIGKDIYDRQKVAPQKSPPIEENIRITPIDWEKLKKRLREVENSLDGSIETQDRARKLREQLEESLPDDRQILFDEIIIFCIDSYILFNETY